MVRAVAPRTVELAELRVKEAFHIAGTIRLEV